MEITIINLKTNTRVKITDCEQFKNINIGHKISVNYKDKYDISRYVCGTVCSIEHEIDEDNEPFDYKRIIKIY